MRFFSLYFLFKYILLEINAIWVIFAVITLEIINITCFVSGTGLWKRNHGTMFQLFVKYESRLRAQFAVNPPEQLASHWMSSGRQGTCVQRDAWKMISFCLFCAKKFNALRLTSHLHILYESALLECCGNYPIYCWVSSSLSLSFTNCVFKSKKLSLLITHCNVHWN